MFEDGEEEFDGFKLNQFAMHQIVDDVAVFVLRPPLRTTYRLIIYARDSDLEVRPPPCTDHDIGGLTACLLNEISPSPVYVRVGHGLDLSMDWIWIALDWIGSWVLF